MTILHDPHRIKNGKALFQTINYNAACHKILQSCTCWLLLHRPSRRIRYEIRSINQRWFQLLLVDYPCLNMESDGTTNWFFMWIACLEYMEWLPTDQKANFTAILKTHNIKKAQLGHHFTTTYCFWENETVEKMWRGACNLSSSPFKMEDTYDSTSFNERSC